MKDQAQGLQRINWTVYGKMASISKGGTQGLSYGYDPSGNRISKTATGSDGTSATTDYVRDAQGNVLAVYQYKADASGNLTEGDWLEQHLYGSSRLGMLLPRLVIPASQHLGSDAYVGNDQTENLGNRQYELTNHLGNVLVTVNDVLSRVVDIQGQSAVGMANVVSAQDYYPFGMQMPGRTYIAGGSLNYRYGFNGKENDNEVEGVGDQIDYGMRVYDPRIGKFLSVDPLTGKYPWYTPYQFAGNKPIWAVDLDGLEEANSNAQKVKADKALQEVLNKDYIRMNTPREGANGIFHSATPAEEENHPVRAYIKNFFYYTAEYLTPLVATDQLAAVWKNKEISTDKKLDASLEFTIGLLQPEGPFEGPIKFKGVGEGWEGLTQFEVNKFNGKLGENITTDYLNSKFGQTHTIYEQVTGRFADGTETVFDHVAVNKKTGLVEFTNETKTGGGDYSPGQKRSMNGEAVQLVGTNLPKDLKNTWIQSKNVPYQTTRIIFQTGEIITTY